MKGCRKSGSKSFITESIWSRLSIPPPIGLQFRIELGFSPEDFLIIQVARLDGLKDHLTGIRAMREVIRAIPNAKLLLVGEGPERAKIEPLISGIGTGESRQAVGIASRCAPPLIRGGCVFADEHQRRDSVDNH